MLIQLSTMFFLTMTAVIAGPVSPQKCTGDKNNPTSCRGRKGGNKLNDSEKIAAPQWEKAPPKNGQLDVRENTNVTLTCAVKGRPTPTIRWTAGRKNITKAHAAKYRQKRGKLTIKNVNMDDSGPHTCVADNGLGNLSYTYHINVLENMLLADIDVVNRPENQTAHVGDTVIFLCTSHDWPEPKVFWTRSTEKRGILEVIKHTDSDGALVLHNVSKDDEGLYTCNIENGSVNKVYSGTLRVIEAGESLPFEPRCSLHIKREVVVDHAHGCKTAEPVEMHYCMGSCGRSYYTPRMVVSDQDTPTTEDGDLLTQTCNCCVGRVKALRIVELDCNFGKKKRGFYTLLDGCDCRACAAKGDSFSSNKKHSNIAP